MNLAVDVENLSKYFHVIKKDNRNPFLQFFSPQYEKKEVVSSISFKIQKGERVAFIGPNGAGKSTTIKMLTGIFFPSSGRIRVLDLDPYHERKKLAYKIGAVFGQRSQLWYHLSPLVSFDLLSTIYGLNKKKFLEERDLLIDVFDIKGFMHRPVKELSLGERTRCEVVASLLHCPDILFLDEPTIGLDIISKGIIRDLVYKRSLSDATTLFLTSHDIADIEKVCDRIIMINKGEIVIDTTVKELKQKYIHYKKVHFKTKSKVSLTPHIGLKVLDEKDCLYQVEIDIRKDSMHNYLDWITSKAEIVDLTINDPSLEEIIKTIYEE